ncbi:neutral/alkaline non-lysosomal ceramidase N-terminal domain-containing protein [Cyclobacterium sp.]|uniref:neutral/alkaline non-lysosomal ceramidase N-terminal domain-containing protein n=1 Tax=Cyclobacterium sp. TaxID=1966343 RepID=UPI0019BF8770|nr:neutral/alkaline non-lysosomal ceramidase N-terminal domain-containing protein [Cyclobacterium sp.]MBD3627287.1 neutral/alkaline non-lysosomal ceramidase N-terminal domain-containing protein [Cyclobacterium sp.]
MTKVSPYLTILLIWFIGFSATLHPAFCRQGYSGWRAGVTKVEITPQEPMWMAGYASRDRPSEGVRHAIWAKALVLEDSMGNRAVLVTTDLVGIRQELSQRIRDRLMQEYGLSKDQIILNSSHTHTGPETDYGRYQFQLDQVQLGKIKNYVEILEHKIVALVGNALESLKPVYLHVENGVTRFQVNRRNNKEASLGHQTDLNGPNDYAVPVIKVTDEDGNMTALVFGYACHPTVLSDYQISGDYAGFAQLALEKLYPGTTALFFQGAGADQNPLPRRSVPLAQQYGKELAAAVERVLCEEMKPLEGNLSTAYSEIDLTFARATPTRAELLEITGNSSGYPEYLKQNAKVLMSKLDNGESLITSYPYPVQAWRLGEQAIFSFGGELLIGYAIALKKIFGQDTFVMGYSNDVMAYIPTRTVLEEGGYEGTRSPIFTTPWAFDIEDRIIGEAVKLAEKVGIQPQKYPLTDQ